MQVETTKPSRTAGKRRRKQQPAAPVAPGKAEGEAGGHSATVQAPGLEDGDLVLMLAIANRFRMWADCPHGACRRAGACSGDGLLCITERRGELKRRILAEVVLLLSGARIRSDEFYNYLDEVTADADGAQRP